MDLASGAVTPPDTEVVQVVPVSPDTSSERRIELNSAHLIRSYDSAGQQCL